MLNILSATVTLLAYIPYLRAIAKGKTHPNPVSWWIWTMVGVLLLSSYYSLGSTAGLGLAIAALAGQLMISVLSMFRSKSIITRFDWFCFAAAVATGVFWWLTSSTLITHVLTVIMDFFGWIPTFRKTLRMPGSEDPLAWLLCTIGALLAIANIGTWSVANALYPVSIFCTDSIILFLSFRSICRSK